MLFCLKYVKKYAFMLSHFFPVSTDNEEKRGTKQKKKKAGKPTKLCRFCAAGKSYSHLVRAFFFLGSKI